MSGKTLTGVVFDPVNTPDPLLEASTPTPQESHDDLRAVLGLPHDALLFVMRIDSFEDWQEFGYPNWQNYSFELVGVPEGPTSPAEAPRFTWRMGTSLERIPIIAWRRRVWCRGSRVYLEARWHPVTGERLDVCAVDGLSPTDVAKFYAQSRHLLRQVSDRGRPRGLVYFANAEHLQDTILRIMRQLRHEGRSPTQEHGGCHVL